MAITEDKRHKLHRRLDEVMGTEYATTMMEALPPVGWADVATKRDLDHLEVKMDHLETRMDHLETRMDRLEVRMDRLEIAVTALGVQISELRSELRAEIPKLRTELYKGLWRYSIAALAINSTVTGMIVAAAKLF